MSVGGVCGVEGDPRLVTRGARWAGHGRAFVSVLPARVHGHDDVDECWWAAGGVPGVWGQLAGAGRDAAPAAAVLVLGGF